MAPSRRREDPDDEDYRRLRGGLLNGHTKWVVRIVSTALVAGLGFFIARDRTGIEKEQELQDRRLVVLETSVTALVAAQAAAQAGSAAQWAEVLRRLGSIETDVKDIKRSSR
jgi:hypothetical protein